MERCPWCGDDPLYMQYHDSEWGVPEYDGRALYEKLMLDGFQAGLSWITILRKRENFRRAFDGFQPAVIARYDEAKIAALLADAGIVRHRGKIEGAISGAQGWLRIEEREGFSRWLWGFVGGAPIVNHWESMAQVPAQTPLSVEVSKALKAEGFKFCGPTIVYAAMQAMGLINDHLVSCHRHKAVQSR